MTSAVCGRTDEESAGHPEADTMRGMQGMEGMQGMGSAMMMQMRAHMDSMRAMSGEHMRENLAMHRQMTANMLADFNRQMREMNMSADAAWDALSDSIRNDLTAMPEMTAADLQALMPAHHARMTRLMDMHGAMMKGMSDGIQPAQ